MLLLEKTPYKKESAKSSQRQITAVNIVFLNAYNNIPLPEKNTLTAL